MSEISDTIARPTDKVGRVLFAVSSTLAVIGGFLMCAVAAMTTVSVTARKFINTPVPGDYEMIAVGTGLAVFSFLPLCQLLRQNVVVDIFMIKAPFRFQVSLDIIGSLLYGMIMVIVAWRTTLGGIDTYNTGESTTILDIPYWINFPYAVLCLIVLGIVCLYTAGLSVREFRANRRLDDPSAEERA